MDGLARLLSIPCSTELTFVYSPFSIWKTILQLGQGIGENWIGQVTPQSCVIYMSCTHMAANSLEGSLGSRKVKEKALIQLALSPPA